MAKMEYSNLIFIILERKGNIEDNYLMSERDFKRFFPNSETLLNRDFKIWTESTLKGGTKIRIRKCMGMQDFNRFTSGIYNEVNGGLARHCYQNQFFTADDGGLSCKNLFTVCTAIFAANSTGKLYTPVDMEGNAIDLIPLSIARFIELK